MARNAVSDRGVSVALACRAFNVSEGCYRYEGSLSADNAEIADLLTALTHNRKRWGFGLCFDYLRNIKGLQWDKKRVYRIYCELELNLRVRPKKRLKREKPEALAGFGNGKTSLLQFVNIGGYALICSVLCMWPHMDRRNGGNWCTSIICFSCSKIGLGICSWL